MADYSAALAKGAVNLVPIVGPLLAEMLGVQIPRQRIDRIAKFAADLDQRLSLVEKGRLESQIENEEFTDLVEEGMRQASHSLSDERRSYIASMVANGLSSENISYAESRHLMRLLDEINDIEIICLRSYNEPPNGDKTLNTFRETHKETLTRVRANIQSPKEIRYQEALQENCIDHLAQLGMLKRRYQIDTKTNIPRFNRSSGAMEIWYHDLTNLGRLMLEEIGLGDEEDYQ